MKNIAVLLTCYNRVGKTLLTLESLYSNIIPQGYNLDVYLVDDGSTDNTTEAVNKNFPNVYLIKGSGQLYWNQGIRLAWKNAANKKEYDFYFWLNDDTILDKNCIEEVINTYNEASTKEKSSVIVTIACRSKKESSIFSYGGRSEKGPIIPNGCLQKCKYINGNGVLVPKEIYEILGNLSNDYTHGIGDIDYGLRAAQNNFNCYTSKHYLATCPMNNSIPTWRNPDVTIFTRLKSLHSPLGMNIKEYIHFRKKFHGYKWLFYAAKVYLKILFPRYYKQKYSDIPKTSFKK